MKTKLNYVLIIFIYGGISFLMAYINNDINYFDLAFFVLGICLGIFLMFLDEFFLYKYYLEPSAIMSSTSDAIQNSSLNLSSSNSSSSNSSSNMTLDATDLLTSTTPGTVHSPTNISDLKLTTRSLLFMLSLFPLGLFIITSTGSKLGIGLFLGIITMLLLELIKYRKNSKLFHKRFMFQLKRTLSIKEINIFIIGFSVLTLLFNLLIFF